MINLMRKVIKSDYEGTVLMKGDALQNDQPFAQICTENMKIGHNR